MTNNRQLSGVTVQFTYLLYVLAHMTQWCYGTALGDNDDIMMYRLRYQKFRYWYRVGLCLNRPTI